MLEKSEGLIWYHEEDSPTLAISSRFLAGLLKAEMERELWFLPRAGIVRRMEWKWIDEKGDELRV